MTRTTLATSAMTLVGAGNWLSLFRLERGQTKVPYPVEICARNNGKFLAAKCLLLATDTMYPKTSDTSLRGFCQNLVDIGMHNIKVQFLAADRPITYFGGLEFTANHQLEIPGGIVEPNESVRLAALREAVEEGGLKGGVERFIRSTSLVNDPCPWDAGGQVEAYCIDAALVHGTPTPPAREGINPDNCALIPLLEAQDWLLGQRANGICVEGYAITALALLCQALHGGWKSLA